MKPNMQGGVSSTGGRIGAATLYRDHAPFIAGFLRRLGVPAADLEDAVQEVFVVAHRKGGYTEGPALPRTWLAAIALRVAQAGRRTRQRREAAASPMLDAVPDFRGNDPAAAIENRRRLDRVQRALDVLPLEQRAAFVLFEIEGESCESIAVALGVPLGTVYSRLHYARQHFLKAHDGLLDRERNRELRKLEAEP
jgi:RNA polymerase sigma-70 factor (ECF subfamily)